MADKKRTKGNQGQVTEFIQDDVENFLKEGHCDQCLIQLSEAYDTDRMGCIEVYGVYDDNNKDLIGFLCPECYGVE